MRSFAPSLLAFSAGVAWLAVSTTFIPASEGARPLGINKAASLDGACSTATMIARLADVDEASGITVSRRSNDILWTHNDSGEPVLYAIGLDGKVRGRVRVAGAQVDDWESITAGPCPEGSCLYVADIGDNKEERPFVTIYQVPEPEPDAGTTVPAKVLKVSYPGQPQDAEGLFIGPDGRLYLVTKGEGSPISIYRVPADATSGAVRLERVATLSGEERKDQRITDADATPDARWVVLRTLDSIEFHRTGSLLAGNADEGVAVRVKKIGEPQGEGVTILADGTVYLAGEAGDGVHGGTLARLSCKLP